MGPPLFPSHTGSEVANLAVQHISCINNFSYIQTRVHASPTSPSFTSPKTFVSPYHSPLGMSTDMWFEQISVLNLDSRRAKAIMVLTDRCSPQKAAEMLRNSNIQLTRTPSDVKRDVVNILFQSESVSQHAVVTSGDNPSDEPACSPKKSQEFVIAEYISSHTRRTISIALNRAIETYRGIILAPMVKAIEDNDTELEIRRNPSGSTMLQLPQKSRRELKKKFSDWNEMWEGVGCCCWFIVFTLLSYYSNRTLPLLLSPSLSVMRCSKDHYCPR